MNTRRNFLTAFIASLSLLSTAFVSVPVGAGEPKVRLAVVVAKDSPVTDISIYELKRLYLGERINAAGKRLVPFNLAPLSRERSGFDKTVLGMSPDALARYWVDRKIRGESGPPKTVEPADVLQRVVVKLDGAVGYAPLNEMRPDVKAIRIDGKGPNDPGYPLEF